RLSDFSEDLGSVLEFLGFNATAFSKILKTHDKSTGSNIRDVRLAELRERLPCLYGGGELRECKDAVEKWTKQLEGMLQKDVENGDVASDSSAGPECEGLTEVVGLSRKNSVEVKSFAEANLMKAKCVNGKNPQESNEMHKTETEQTLRVMEPVQSKGETRDHLTTPRIAHRKSIRESSERLRDGTEKTNATASVHSKEETTMTELAMHSTEEEKRTEQSPPPSRRASRRKSAQVVHRMIGRVARELRLQKANSPFFGLASDSDPPPSFASAELDLAGQLGQGEYCQI
ncbi:hypothetical protein ACHAWF_000532, partial [Thalassiosira exigua]